MQDNQEVKILEYRYQSLTHVGKVRTMNEDALIESPATHLFGVCDGMGGHAAGEVASSLAASAFKRVMAKNTQSSAIALRKAIRQAEERICRDQTFYPEHQGMGTTLSAFLLSGPKPEEGWVIHVGDSRVYRCRMQHLEQLTSDHSPTFRLYQEGLLSKEQARAHPKKHVLDQALGLNPPAQTDVFAVDVQERDLFLLCTDGLSDQLGDSEIQDICRDTPFSDLAQHLVDSANAKGGLDNVSVILIEILPTDEQLIRKSRSFDED